MPINFQVPMENLAELSNGNETGICMAISCFWIRRCRQLQAVPGAMDMFFTNWREYETMAVAFETLLGDYNLATGGDATINSQQRLQANSLTWHNLFFRQLGLPPMEILWGTLDTLDYLLATMENGGMRGYILTGYATQNAHGGALLLNGGHTVAFWYSAPATTKTFMDPNFGQYTVLRANPWGAAIIQHLQYYYPNFNQWVLIGIG